MTVGATTPWPARRHTPAGRRAGGRSGGARSGAADRGQVLPALMLLVGAVVSAGLLLFQVGQAATLRAEAVTAADSAAIAAAQALGGQLAMLDQAGVDDAAVRAAAARYAEANGATLVSYERVGALDVRVTVASAPLTAGTNAGPAHPGHAVARARARVGFAALGPGGGVPIGDLSGNIVDAIQLAQRMGLVVTSTTGGRHTPTSWHYKGKAADVAGPPQLMAAFYDAALRRYSAIEELFYDPRGGIKKNRQIGPIGGHSDHVHIALLGDEIGDLPEATGPGPPGAAAGPIIPESVELVPWDG